MKTIQKTAATSTIVVAGFCLFAGLLVLFKRDVYIFEESIYGWLVSQTVPQSRIFQVALSRRTALQIYPNAEGILWLGTKWTNSGNQIEIYDSRSEVYASTLMLIDPEDAVYNGEIQAGVGGNIFGLLDNLPFVLADGESLWGACLDEDIFFTAKHIEDDLWEARLWKGERLVKAFEPIEFRFGPYQSGFKDEPVGVAVEFSNFSPDCRYFTIDSYKDTWILDTVKRSFEPLKIKRTQLLFENVFSLMDTTCYQCITPAWAPSSLEFAFTSYNGVEKYDVISDKRSWLVAPNNNASALEWARTGSWILGVFNGSYSVIASDGSSIGLLEGCEDMSYPSWSSSDTATYNENVSWAPTEDKLAFICHQYDRSTCVDGKCEKERYFLIIWDLSNLEGE